MLRIDFIGPPGVGKTHLFEALERTAISTGVLSCRQARSYAAKTMFPRWWLMRLADSRIKPERELLNQIRTKEIKKTGSLSSSFDNIFEKKITRILTERNKISISSLSLFNYLLDLLSEIGHYNELFTKEIVYFDESLTHHMEVSDLVINHTNKVDGLLSSGVIALKCRPELIVERILSRSKLIDRHLGLSQQEILHDTLLVIEAINVKENILRELGVPLLEIDTEEPTQVSANNIIQWIHTLAQ